MSRPKIAKAVGAGVSTIQDLEQSADRQPRHPLGQALLKLHAERVVGQSRSRGK